MKRRCCITNFEVGYAGLQPGFILQGLILKLLSQKPLHGYEILTKIEERFPNIPAFRELVENGLGYRILRNLEAMGFITSEWEVSEGPARRVYKITEKGLEALNTFKKELDALKNAIDSFKNFLSEEV